MFKVLKYLKYTAISVIAIIILLCVQATVDLRLPDYTSKIVNTGIQAGGIEEAIPEIISKEDMETLLIFASNKEELLSKYDFVETTTNLANKHQKNIVNKYLGKNELENIYILKDISDDEKSEIAKNLAGNLMEFSTIKKKK